MNIAATVAAVGTDAGRQHGAVSIDGDLLLERITNSALIEVAQIAGTRCESDIEAARSRGLHRGPGTGRQRPWGQFGTGCGLEYEASNVVGIEHAARVVGEIGHRPWLRRYRGDRRGRDTRRRRSRRRAWLPISHPATTIAAVTTPTIHQLRAHERLGIAHPSRHRSHQTVQQLSRWGDSLQLRVR